MTQTRQVHQVKYSRAELVIMFRDMAIKALVDNQTIDQEQAAALVNAPTNWRGTIDGGIAVLLDPVWPEA